jgi:hypothetical protein
MVLESNKKISKIFPALVLLFISLLLISALEVQATENNSDVIHKVNGIWKFDGAKTLELRIIKGIPFHIGDRYGMGGGGRVIRQFDNGAYRFYDEKRIRLVDKGKYRIVESNKDEVVLRLFPEDDFENANKYKFKDLIHFTQLAGYNIPYIIGLRFIDNNTVQSFSYVRGFGNNMVKKDDNAYWKKISKLPQVISIKERKKGGKE